MDVVIEKVGSDKPSFKGKPGQKKKLILKFKGIELPYACGAVVGRQIADACGSPMTEQWIGKTVTLYASTTMVGQEERECIRVKRARQTAPVAPVAAEVAK